MTHVCSHSPLGSRRLAMVAALSPTPPVPITRTFIDVTLLEVAPTPTGTPVAAERTMLAAARRRRARRTGECFGHLVTATRAVPASTPASARRKASSGCAPEMTMWGKKKVGTPVTAKRRASAAAASRRGPHRCRHPGPPAGRPHRVRRRRQDGRGRRRHRCPRPPRSRRRTVPGSRRRARRGRGRTPRPRWRAGCSRGGPRARTAVRRCRPPGAGTPDMADHVTPGKELGEQSPCGGVSGWSSKLSQVSSRGNSCFSASTMPVPT